MLKLIAKTQSIGFPELLVNHTFWTIAFPGDGPLLTLLLDRGMGRITVEGSWIVVTAFTEDWYDIADWICSDPNKALKTMGSVLVQSYPELFGKLSRTLQTDGTLVIRR